ncbi:MAG: hypothetical protein ACD_51C00016G0004 [uncultured bacterium]|nr:MAG: hypothetical protein ACD_51C00016G0004 [uncultured bacterium]OGJ47242.1 MAG: hypothetical protein A2244_00140 [Candidatus Peregrinibacteria bacterium RIFOXYA2_FULL_41_18]OGJ49689.1 MAG: hypothetical protein A2344_02120 [Candidatus Peregrinibacteria bacterium RIFOXYB12_FULL_41_12]OGJ53025.1 MAG: hypothetical protein A2336_03425 [Candidatus Peregrinibacteria bacterium RIFOXYB2_FULL_41_88]OGJ53501.1 MAG: hypothetical protein A2448_02360 [Candidatus Peregrinibacteria bacterium RIFOXYC2_FULL
MDKILGLDYGKRRTGVAISDGTHSIAFTRNTISFNKEEAVLKEIEKICKIENVSKIVIGLPCNMSGEYTPQTEETLAFAERLKKHTGEREIEMFDERLSSLQAEKALVDKKMKKYSEIDSIAAQIILQAYLDKHRS